MRISMIGTRGIPARYGGFETCVEQVGARLADAGHEVTVYCRDTTRPALTRYRGMALVPLPALRRKTLETLSHSALSMLHAAGETLRDRKPDAAFVFNAANAPLLPLLRASRIPVATHVDGLEWQRGKWGAAGRRYYRAAEALAVRWSDALIADAQGIARYFADRFGATTTYLPYGAPRCDGIEADRLAGLRLTPGEYHLVVARFEPENHVHLAVEGYLASRAEWPLVVVGSAPYAGEYTAIVSRACKASPRVRLLGAVWDQQLLDQLYAHALTYIHGHSVGGTNPSLLRAMGAGTATSAYDVEFNREVLGEHGGYFRDTATLAALCEVAEADPEGTRARGKAQLASLDRYDWDRVAEGYAALARALAGR